MDYNIYLRPFLAKQKTTFGCPITTLFKLSPPPLFEANLQRTDACNQTQLEAVLSPDTNLVL